MIGVGLSMISIGLIALGLVKAREWGWSSAIVCVAAGLALLGWFIARSRGARAAVIDLSLFESTSFRYSNIATFVFGATFSAMFLGSVLFLTNVWGYSTFQAGLGMTPGPLIVMVVAPLAGRLAARHGHRVLLIPGGVIFALGFLLRYMATSSTPHYIAEWLPAVIPSGIGVGLILPSLAAAATHNLAPHRFALGSGVNQAIRQIGAVLGVAIIIAMVGRARGPEALPAFETMFLLLGLGGILTSLISTTIDTRPSADSARIDAGPAPPREDNAVGRSHGIR